MAQPVIYFVRRGHLPIARFLLIASVALWGCGPRAPAAESSQQQSPQGVSKLQVLARTPGVAIRLPAKGGVPQLYKLPRLTAVDGVLKGRLPPVERVVGLDPESEFLFVTTAKRELLALDLTLPRSCAGAGLSSPRFSRLPPAPVPAAADRSY